MLNWFCWDVYCKFREFSLVFFVVFEVFEIVKGFKLVMWYDWRKK